MSLRKERIHTKSLSLAAHLQHNVSQSLKSTLSREWLMARSSKTQITPSPTLPLPRISRKWTSSLNTLELGELQTEDQPPPLPELKKLHQLLELRPLSPLQLPELRVLSLDTAHECKMARHLRDLQPSVFLCSASSKRTGVWVCINIKSCLSTICTCFSKKSFSSLVLSVAFVCLFRSHLCRFSKAS